MRFPPVRTLVGVLTLFVLAGPLSAGEAVPRAKVGDLALRTLSTTHPYPAGTVATYEIHHPGATYIKVHFSRFELAPGDWLEIATPDGSESYFFSGDGYKGKGRDFWVNSVLGDRVRLRLHSITGGRYGFDTDYYAHGLVPLFNEGSAQTRSVCGSIDWQNAECYATSFPTEFDRAKRAVVVLLNGVENCSGVKVGCPNQFLTNEHCVTNQTEVDLTEVRFEYQTVICNSVTTTFSASYLGDQFIADDFTLDYSLFTAEGESASYLAAEIDPRLPPVGERMYITGHPSGLPKKISLEDSGSPTGLCQVDVSPIDGNGTDTDVGYFCDTASGSSGSPVWSGDTHKLIALHHFGGCPNSGVRMDLIHPQIESLLTSCCAAPPLPPTLTATSNGGNRIDLIWDDSELATVIEYRLLRSETSGGPYSEIAVVADTSPGLGNGPDYLYVDTDVQGGITYHYIVSFVDGGGCSSSDSNEASATATGSCNLAPVFAGVKSVINLETATCALDVTWDPASAGCGNPVRYFVYRDSATPVAAIQSNLVTAGVSGTRITDAAGLLSGTTYHYLVRAQDAVTGQSEANTIEASAFPGGAGSGSLTVLDEDFEVPASFADWTVTTGPGVHFCGAWNLSSAPSKLPLGGSGSFALADNTCDLGRTSTTLTSPTVDVNLADIASVTLEYDIWYNHDGSESGTVDVYDGSTWVTVWQDSDTDLNGHQSIDVTSHAAGNSTFQVRFDYQDALQDQWFSVDNVEVIVLIDAVCATAPPGPGAVPDGSAGTVPLRGERLSSSGDTIGVTWDTACSAADYNLLYGDLAGVGSSTITGSECSLVGSGSHTWTAVPGGDLFFLVVGADGAGTEGSWGIDGYGGERNGLSASGECAVTLKDPSNTCQ